MERSIEPVEVERVRRDLRLTRHELASVLGISTATIGRWSVGRRTRPTRLATSVLLLLSARNDLDNLGPQVRRTLMMRGPLHALHELLGVLLPRETTV
jgi:DNA-binding XRE family transcriptional regulator